MSTSLPTVTADPYFFYLTLPGRETVRIASHRGDVLSRILSAWSLARLSGEPPKFGTLGNPTQEMIRAFGAALNRKEVYVAPVGKTAAQVASAKAADERAAARRSATIAKVEALGLDLSSIEL